MGSNMMLKSGEPGKFLEAHLLGRKKNIVSWKLWRISVKSTNPSSVKWAHFTSKLNEHAVTGQGQLRSWKIEEVGGGECCGL
jgi:hypothetical protein